METGDGRSQRDIHVTKTDDKFKHSFYFPRSDYKDWKCEKEVFST